MKFTKYRSLVNVDTKQGQLEIEHARANVPEFESFKYVATEKLDGANFSIQINAQDVDEYLICSRNGVIEDKFHNYQSSDYEVLLDLLQNQILNSGLCEWAKEHKSVSLIGWCELFGKSIQKRINYPVGSYVKMYGCTIVVDIDTDEEIHIHAGYDDLVADANKYGYRHYIQDPLKTFNSLEDAMKFDIEGLVSNHIDKSLTESGKEIKEIAEGVVFHPTHSFGILTGEKFCRYKKKTKRFNDKSKTRVKVPKEYPEHLTPYLEEGASLINHNRLLDVYSKESCDIRTPKDIGKFVKLLTEDATADFSSLSKLTKDEMNDVKIYMSKLAGDVVRDDIL